MTNVAVPTALAEAGIAVVPSIAGYAYRGVEPTGVWPFVDDIHIRSVRADKITAGTITVDLEIGDGTIDIDGANNQITVSDGTPTVRVRIGDLGADYGISIYNAAGVLMWSMTDGAQTDGIANSAVTNGKIASMAVDKLTTGNLTATVDVTSGVIRTASSGARLELDTIGLVIYDSADDEALTLDQGGLVFQTKTTEANTDALRWFREGEADASHFAQFSARQTSALVASKWEVVPKTAAQAAGGAIALWLLDEAGTKRAIIELDGASDAGDTSAVELKTFHTDSSSGGRFGTYADEQGQGHRNELWGLTKFAGDDNVGSGFLYNNGFEVTDASVLAGATDSQNITYADEFPAESDAPSIVGGSNGGDYPAFWRAHTRTRTGCTVALTNLDSSTRSLNVACLPVVTL